jgi:predicted N-acyltransferase
LWHYLFYQKTQITIVLTFKIFTSIHDIDYWLWDAHISPIHFYHTYAFLSCLEDAKVEGADFWYIMIYHQDRLICTASLSSFVINLDLMIGSHWLSKFVKWTGTGLFRVKILFCGTPVSIGHKNIFCSDGFESECYAIIGKIMEDLAQENEIKHLVFKEFLDCEETYVTTILTKLGYFRGYSLPYISMPVHWDDYNDYISKMRSGYRRQIIASRRKLVEAVSIKIMDANSCDVSQFYKGYISVMSRAEVKLEILNEAFFFNFFDRMRSSAKLISLCEGDQILTSLLAVEVHGTLYFVWASKPDARDDLHHSYFNLLDTLIRYGIEKKVNIIHLGQTAYYTKQRFGGKATDVFLFYKALQPWKHAILSKLSSVIFPKMNLEKVNVWK